MYKGSEGRVVLFCDSGGAGGGYVAAVAKEGWAGRRLVEFETRVGAVEEVEEKEVLFVSMLTEEPWR